MTTSSQTLKRIVNNAYANLFIGVILLITCLIEIWDTMVEDIIGMNFKGEHGLIIFAVAHILKTLPDIMVSLDRFEMAEKQ